MGALEVSLKPIQDPNSGKREVLFNGMNGRIVFLILDRSGEKAALRA